MGGHAMEECCVEVSYGASCSMSFKLSQKQPSDTDSPSAHAPGGSRLSSWLLRLRSFTVNAWEAYPILLVAAFLRFYQINTTGFDDDEAKIYRLSYDVGHHG